MAGEKIFENRIKRFLKDEGCWFIKYWAGAAFTKTGIPDLLICCNGYFVAVEVKADNGRPSELQLWHIEKIKEAGGHAIVSSPNQFDEFQQLIKQLKGGD